MVTPDNESWGTVACPTSWGHGDAGALHLSLLFPLCFSFLLSSLPLLSSSLLPPPSTPSFFLFLKDLFKSRDKGRVSHQINKKHGQWSHSRNEGCIQSQRLQCPTPLPRPQQCPRASTASRAEVVWSSAPEARGRLSGSFSVSFLFPALFPSPSFVCGLGHYYDYEYGYYF